VLLQKISILPHRRFLGLNPPTKFQFRLILSFKNFGPNKTPLLLGISNDPLWWGYGYFLEPHNGDKPQITGLDGATKKESLDNWKNDCFLKVT